MNFQSAQFNVDEFQEKRILRVLFFIFGLGLFLLLTLAAAAVLSGKSAILITLSPFFVLVLGGLVAVKFKVRPSLIGLLFSVSLVVVHCHQRLLSSPDQHAGFIVTMLIFPLYFQLNTTKRSIALCIVHFLGLVASWQITVYAPPYEFLHTPEYFAETQIIMMVLIPLFIACVSLVNSLQMDNLVSEMIQKNFLLMAKSADYKNLLGVIIHDISGIMLRLDGYYDLVDGDVPDPKPKNMLRLKKAIDDMMEVVKGTQKMSSNIDYNDKINPIPVAVETLVEKAKLMNVEKMEDKFLRVDFSAEEGAEEILVEPVTFSFHVFNNIFLNAVKFAISESDICVAFLKSEKAGRVNLKISNLCDYADEDKLSKALSGKGSVNPGTGSKGEVGQGIGLQIAVHFCTMFEYRIKFDIEHLESGKDRVNFYLEVPAASEEELRSEMEMTEPEKTAA